MVTNEIRKYIIKNFQKCFAEIKDIEMKKLYSEFLGDLEKNEEWIW